MRMTVDKLGEALDLQGLSVEDFELLDSFFFRYETAVIRTQVSSCFWPAPEDQPPKARSKPESSIHADIITEKCMKQHFKTVSEMIRRGYCCDRHGRIQPIPGGVRIGIPDDDIPVQPAEFQAMLDCVEEDNLRDHLFLGFAFRSGARESQDRAVKISDIDFVRSRVFIRAAKEGISFYRILDADFLAELAEYVRFYHLCRDDYLFSVWYTPQREQKWEKSSDPISRETAETIFEKYAVAAGVQYKYVDVRTGELRNRIHPHTAKYTFCSIGYDKEPSMLKVALTVGNKTIYPLMQNYIKVPTWQRHKVAEEVISELTCRHHNVLVKLINPTNEAPEVEQ
jgi:integrase